MDSALAWIGQIAAWVGQWIPRWTIVDTTYGAIKFKRGKNPVFCGPGVHFWWPALSTFERFPTARQTDRLESQTMETLDSKTFLVSGTITYSVDDLMLLLPTTYSPSRTVIDLAMTAVHEVCAELTWEGLQGEQHRGTLKTKLKNAAQKQLTEYGVKVLKLQLNTLARCRVIKISQSTASEEN